MSDRKFRVSLPALLLAGLSVAACSSLPAAINDEVVRSTLYDDVPCAQLKAQRDALVGQYGDPATEPGERQPGEPTTPTGFSVVIPDLRSAETKERGLARGQVVAMASSLKRRQCAG